MKDFTAASDVMKGWLAAVVLVAVGVVAVVMVVQRNGSPSEPPEAASVGSLSGSRGGGELVVYSSPGCGCCREWVAYLERHGFATRTVALKDVSELKRELGVPEELWSCHTAVWEGFVIEGHVPVEALRAFAAGPGGAMGLAVPGMPAGSPGMTGELAEPLAVFTFGRDGVKEFMTLAEFEP